jgi:hypothetical protein
VIEIESESKLCTRERRRRSCIIREVVMFYGSRASIVVGVFVLVKSNVRIDSSFNFISFSRK